MSFVLAQIVGYLNYARRLDEAEDVGREAIKDPNAHILASYVLGLTYLRNMKIDEAREIMMKVLRQDPDLDLRMRIDCGDITDWKKWAGLP
jgi:tetratricopeptide (TPR) repeat protein